MSAARELPHRAGMATAPALLGTAALFHLAAGWARRRRIRSSRDTATLLETPRTAPSGRIRTGA